MTVLELVQQLDPLKREYKRQIDDLPRNYVRGTKVFEQAADQIKENYETSKAAIKEQITNELIKIEAKAETDQKFYESLSEPTAEEVVEGYKIIDVIAKTHQCLSETTLEKLVMKVKNMDQLAVINDVIASTGDLGLKRVVRERIVALDSFVAEQRDTMQLVQDFKEALATSGDSITYTVMALASQLSQVE